VTGVTGNPGGLRDAGRADAAAAAVTDLFRGHHLELVRLALLMTGDVATAEDVVQDAFERLHRRWPSLRRQDSSLAYVRSSVLNGCPCESLRSVPVREYTAG
jgi:DNA-directed RNA polymerase specialized sigma24 family protein